LSSTGKPMRADAQRNRARILDAAERVFADGGPAASTEEVARRAGVAIGTVFRHFPTKADLLAALMKRLLADLTTDAAELAATGDPATALFDFTTRLVDRTAANRTIVDLLAAEGRHVTVAEPLHTLTSTVTQLLVRGQQSGALRADLRSDEVMALLTAACQGALTGAWPTDLRHRTLEIIYTGMRTTRFP
jgi:AcrR family transcriptional regulator